MMGGSEKMSQFSGVAVPLALGLCLIPSQANDDWMKVCSAHSSVYTDDNSGKNNKRRRHCVCMCMYINWYLQRKLAYNCLVRAPTVWRSEVVTHDERGLTRRRLNWKDNSAKLSEDGRAYQSTRKLFLLLFLLPRMKIYTEESQISAEYDSMTRKSVHSLSLTDWLEL